MTKKYDPNVIQNELASGSSFFSNPSPSNTNSNNDIMRDGIIESKVVTPDRDITHDVMPSPLPSSPEEFILKRVKRFGKEATTLRLTVEEKKELEAIKNEFRSKDYRTTENEMARVCLNFIIFDYKTKGDQSILSKILRELYF